MTISSWLVPAVVLLTWVDWLPSGWGLPARGGFVWGTAAVLVCFVTVGWSTCRSESGRRGLLEFAGAHRWLLFAVGGIVSSRLLSSFAAEDQLSGFFVAARDGLVLLYLILILIMVVRERAHLEKIRERLAWIGLGILLVQVGLYVVGSFDSGWSGVLFQWEVHQHAQRWPRFRGGTGQPMQLGWNLLLIAGLVRGIRQPRIRLAATTVALGLVAATASFATLTLPIVLVGAVIKGRKLRVSLTVAAATLAIVGLWFNPLTIDLFGTRILSRQPLASYYDGELGPTIMPIHVLGTATTQISFHQTAYFSLFVRGVECLADNPLLGVGGRNFESQCRVMAMNTAGQWTDRRTSHSEYGGLLAEQGLVGVLSALFLVWVLFCRYRRPERRDFVLESILIAYLVTGVGGPIWYQFGFAALLGTYWVQVPLGVSSLSSHVGVPKGR